MLRSMAQIRTPAQVVSLLLGGWWALNGIAAFIADGHVDVAVNEWHALFHFLPGVLGLAVATRARAARAYTLGAGSLYLVAASWGFIAGDRSLGVVAVDTLGNAVHAVEGLIAVTAGLLSLGPGASPITPRGRGSRRSRVSHRR
jgi:Domain of unknown function (DUF4383)